MTCTAILHIAASGDWSQVTTVLDESGAAIDLTGYSATIEDETGELAGSVDAEIVDAAAGTVRLTVTWQAGWALSQRLLGTARLLLSSGSTEHGTQPFSVYVAAPAVRIVAPRGSDVAYAFTWPDDRDGSDLSGETLDVINASAALSGLITVSVTDAATSACEIQIEGDMSVALGDAGTFQLRRRIAGADPRTTKPFAVSFR